MILLPLDIGALVMLQDGVIYLCKSFVRWEHLELAVFGGLSTPVPSYILSDGFCCHHTQSCLGFAFAMHCFVL